jgi:hypothetical protein
MTKDFLSNVVYSKPSCLHDFQNMTIFMLIPL